MKDQYEEMAHDWAMNCLNAGLTAPMADLVAESWAYADAMKVEADKRKDKKIEEWRKGLKDLNALLDQDTPQAILDATKERGR